MSYSIESLGLRTLEVDENNPRFPPTESQDEAIRQMLDYIPEKIIAIARDISKNGLNPLVTPAVLTTEDGKNIVKDGNRRITAIKLMMDPSLTKDPELRRKFEKIGANINRSDFKFISCAVFNDEEEVDHWIKLNHQNNLSGIGHEDWGAIPKMRDSRNHGKVVPVLEMYEMTQKKIPNLDEDVFPISTFERLVKSKDFKGLTGWKLEGNSISVDMPKDVFINGLVEVFNDLTNRKSVDFIDSRSINNTRGIKEYIGNKTEKGFFKKSKSDVISIGSTNIKLPKGKQKTRTRKGVVTLITKDTAWIIENPRLNDLFEELKSISVESHPNVVSILLRAFVEMSTKWYAINNGAEDNHLDKRMVKIADKLYAQGKITDEARKAVKSTVNKDDGVADLNQDLNQYGHNYLLNPTSAAVVSVFNSIKPMFDAMFNQE